MSGQRAALAPGAGPQARAEHRPPSRSRTILGGRDTLSDLPGGRASRYVVHGLDLTGREAIGGPTT